MTSILFSFNFTDYITAKIQALCNLSMPDDGSGEEEADDISKEKKEAVAMETYKQTSDPM